MTPDQLAKADGEHSHQRALLQWCNVAAKHGFAVAWAWSDSGSREAFKASSFNGQDLVPELNWLFAIPNGGLRDKITAAKLKHEGVKPGVPDLMLPWPCRAYAGLFIEMKRPEQREEGVRKATRVKRAAGSTSGVQDEWIGQLRHVGYAVGVAFNWRDAATQLQSYIEQARG